MRIKYIGAAAAAATVAASLSMGAQQSAAPSAPARGTFDFTIKGIMRGHDLVGRTPSDVRWSADSKWIYFAWNPPGTNPREPLVPYRVRAEAGAAPESLSVAQMDSAGPLAADGDLSTDRGMRAAEWGGDIYVVNLRTGALRRLTNTVARETDPHFDRGAKHVFFVRDNNVFAFDLSTGEEKQLSDIRLGPKPKDKDDEKLTAQRAALEAQQRELLGAVRDEVHLDSLRKQLKAESDSLKPATLWLRKDETVNNISVSPSGNALLLVTTIAAGDKQKVTDIPHYVSKSGYTEPQKSREKVGDVLDGGRVAYIPITRGDPVWLALVAGDTVNAPGLAQVDGWSDDGAIALVFVVSPDWKTRYIYTVGAKGALSALDTLRDSAWVDGPAFGEAGFVDGGKRIWFVSEADGYAHLYTMSSTGGDKKQLTRGKWEVDDVSLSNDKRTFYLTTSEQSPFEEQIYRMPVTGGARTQITKTSGGHTVVVSPNELLLADVYSTSNRPPEIYVMRNQPGAPESRLTLSPTAEWLSFPWLIPQIVMVPASDGVQVPARIYTPKDMSAQPNGAAVIFVHGAGYLHNVNHYWSYYFREYMFNHYLASKGYVVIDIDYRGSAGYGRDWRTAIYRHMGGRDLQDEVDGSKYLHDKYGIDPKRIGIYGGSYGGFMTLMALFTESPHFGAGAAVRSVTDWAHYNHGYTSRILNTPENDSVAYRQSSPIYFAEGLKDPLLMLHGMVDDNVHFQDIVRLTQRLIELGKTNWDLAVYPVERHDFVRTSSWQDEYRRIYELFDRTIAHPGTASAPH
ncbi:MAG: prolyl oligopeptidase family serine peptidase [Gemmatimonadota bacterium]|nr:prolyl oligopeptidase family serine peptidase [Gemmatimonadota bacterium]